MRASIISGCLMTAVAFAVASPVSTASADDLYGERYADQPYEGQDDGAAYADDRYDDQRYDPPNRYADAPRSDGYEYRDYGDDRGSEPLPGSIKDGYPVPMPPPTADVSPREPRYVERRPARVERYAGCLDRQEIKRRLRDEGWTTLEPVGGNERIVRIHARRFDSSSDFRLRVDKCSGEVISARPDTRRYAYRDWRRHRDW